MHKLSLGRPTTAAKPTVLALVAIRHTHVQALLFEAVYRPEL